MRAPSQSAHPRTKYGSGWTIDGCSDQVGTSASTTSSPHMSSASLATKIHAQLASRYNIEFLQHLRGDHTLHVRFQSPQKSHGNRCFAPALGPPRRGGYSYQRILRGHHKSLPCSISSRANPRRLGPPHSKNSSTQLSARCANLPLQKIPNQRIHRRVMALRAYSRLASNNFSSNSQCHVFHRHFSTLTVYT